MSLRDYFAAKALQAGLIVTVPSGTQLQDIIKTAYGIADAMLAERSREK